MRRSFSCGSSTAFERRGRLTLAFVAGAIGIACTSSNGAAPGADGAAAGANAGVDAAFAGVAADGAAVTPDGTLDDDASGRSDSSAGADAGPSDAARADAPSDANGAGDVVDASGFFDVAADDGGSCNSITDLGAEVQQVDVATARPAATGGTVLDGMYLKTGDAEYTGPGGATGPTGYVVRETLTIANAATGTALLGSVFIDNNGTTTERLTLSPTTGGGAATLTFVCPAFGPSPTFYNVHTGGAGQTELDIYISTDRIETFTLQ